MESDWSSVSREELIEQRNKIDELAGLAELEAREARGQEATFESAGDELAKLVKEAESKAKTHESEGNTTAADKSRSEASEFRALSEKNYRLGDAKAHIAIAREKEASHTKTLGLKLSIEIKRRDSSNFAEKDQHR